MEGIDKSLPTFESLGLSKQKPAEQQRLSQEDFMKLMMAQMQHQDPMKPMENGDFISQMAQFSSVEGLKSIKDSFNTLANTMQSSQALQASSMVGRKVMVPGDTAELTAGGMIRGGAEITQETESVVIKVLDKAGQTVYSKDLGKQAPGTAMFEWDGVIKQADESIPGNSSVKAEPGKYKLVAEAMVDGQRQRVETFSVDKVDSVSLAKGGQGVTLNLSNNGATSLADVREII